MSQAIKGTEDALVTIGESAKLNDFLVTNGIHVF